MSPHTFFSRPQVADDSAEGMVCAGKGWRGMRGQGTTKSFTAAAADLTSHTLLVDTAGRRAPAGRQAGVVFCVHGVVVWSCAEEGASLMRKLSERTGNDERHEKDVILRGAWTTQEGNQSKEDQKMLLIATRDDDDTLLTFGSYTEK